MERTPYCAASSTLSSELTLTSFTRPAKSAATRSSVGPRARHDYPVAVAGDGVYLIDGEGRRYLDASGGAAVSCLGHSDRAVSDAIARQLDRLPYAHTSFFTNEPMETLAERLVATAPAPLDPVYFTCGG